MAPWPDRLGDEADATLEKSRDMEMQLHDGARYRYRHHSDQLQVLAPLNLGKDPAEDGVRLATLARELPLRTPPFVWLPDEGLTLAALKKQIDAHKTASETEIEAGSALKAALKLLREQRPAAHHLWDDDGLGLEAWIIAHVPKDQQHAFGRERRKRPRANKTPGKQEEAGTTDEKAKTANPPAENGKPASKAGAETKAGPEKQAEPAETKPKS